MSQTLVTDSISVEVRTPVVDPGHRPDPIMGRTVSIGHSQSRSGSQLQTDPYRGRMTSGWTKTPFPPRGLSGPPASQVVPPSPSDPTTPTDGPRVSRSSVTGRLRRPSSTLPRTTPLYPSVSSCTFRVHPEYVPCALLCVPGVCFALFFLECALVPPETSCDPLYPPGCFFVLSSVSRYSCAPLLCPHTLGVPSRAFCPPLCVPSPVSLGGSGTL